MIPPTSICQAINTATGGAGSGVLISPTTLLTCAHVVCYTGVPVRGDAIKVIPNSPGSAIDGPFGEVMSDRIFVDPIYTQVYSSNHTLGQATLDYAVVHLSRPISGAGFMPLDCLFRGGASLVGGYPGAGSEMEYPDTAVPVQGAPVYITRVYADGTSGGPLFTADNKVAGIYNFIDPTGIVGYVRALDRTLVYWIEKCLAQCLESPEIARLYWGVLNRAPETGGLQFWSQEIVDQNNLVSVAAYFLSCSEYAIAGLDLIPNLYRNCLGRPPEPAGLAFWQAQSPLSAVMGISQSAEAIAFAR